GCCFFRRVSFVGGLLQAERGVQVLAHDPVLELRGLAEHVEQRLAVLDDERLFRRRQAAPSGDSLGEPPPRPRAFRHQLSASRGRWASHRSHPPGERPESPAFWLLAYMITALRGYARNAPG